MKTLVLALLLASHVAGQQQEQIAQRILETWLEQQEYAGDVADLRDQILLHLEHPIDLNKTNADELRQLPFLSEAEIQGILQHRQKFGEYVVVQELQSVSMLREQTLEWLKYMVKVQYDVFEDHTSWINRIQTGKHEVWITTDRDFPLRKGYEQDEKGMVPYAGSPWYRAVRYRFSYGRKLTFGYAGELDAGEAARGNTGVFDFHSAHVMVRDWRWLKAAVIGDYQVSVGQALTFSTGMGLGKSAFVLNLHRANDPLRAYRSLGESGFLRGAAFTLGRKSIQATCWFAHQKVSAGLDTSQNEQQIASIAYSGLHRTANELAQRKQLRQQYSGFHAEWNRQSLRLGITQVFRSYSAAMPPSDKPYSHYRWSGQYHMVTGVSGAVQWKQSHWFGELTRSGNGGTAWLAGCNAALHPKVDVAMLIRSFEPHFQPMNNNAFRHFSDGTNEQGCYVGISMKPYKRNTLNMYADLFRSPWIRYLVDGPSRGVDLFTEWQYAPSKTHLYYARFRYVMQQQNASLESSKTDVLMDEHKWIIRLHLQYPFSEYWSGKTRVEHAVYQHQQRFHGSMIFQEVQFHPLHKRYAVSMRYSLFAVEDFNARLYATEQDVLYHSTVPVFQHSGVRWYVLAHWKVTQHIDAWVKYAQTRYADMQTIGSGNETINGNSLKELRAQMRYTF